MQQASLFAADARRCSGCHETKPVNEFNRLRADSDKRRSICKACTKVERRQQYLAADGVERVRRQNWARYGLTSEAYWALAAEQGGRCAICQDEPEPGKLLHVDHDHVTNAVRALLCQGCNKALGNTRERPDVLRGCADYIERWVAQRFHADRVDALRTDQTDSDPPPLTDEPEEPRP